MTMSNQNTTDIDNHREHLADHLARVNQTDRPMFIQNAGGETQAVILSESQYNALCDDAELMRSLRGIDQSMREIKEGKTQPIDVAMKQIIAEFSNLNDG